MRKLVDVSTMLCSSGIVPRQVPKRILHVDTYVQSFLYLQLAKEFNIAVVITNQVTADPGNMFVPDAKKVSALICIALFHDERLINNQLCDNECITSILFLAACRW